MAGPASARSLPLQTPNSSAPIIDEEFEVRDNKVQVRGLVTQPWRYLFGLFALTTTSVDPNWTQSVSSPPTQAEVQAIVAQVKLLSKALGRTP